MPIVYVACSCVNPEEYESIVDALKPADVPCIRCESPVTHRHGTYLRVPLDLPQGLRVRRRLCPACERTFALLPSFLAPYQRASIPVQDEACARLAKGEPYEDVLRHLDARGLPLFEATTLRRWFLRLVRQVQQILPAVTALAQRQTPEVPLPALRMDVREPAVLAYYERLAIWRGSDATSAAWNLLRRIVCVFAPSVSVNRVSYGLLPTPPP
ncbi:MAG: hypothetical protein K6T83_11550 [Alicyclobacillus sp.]|nr:hypothetical protein [Alicyclobacillus sp.]